MEKEEKWLSLKKLGLGWVSSLETFHAIEYNSYKHWSNYYQTAVSTHFYSKSFVANSGHFNVFKNKLTKHQNDTCSPIVLLWTWSDELPFCIALESAMFDISINNFNMALHEAFWTNFPYLVVFFLCIKVSAHWETKETSQTCKFVLKASEPCYMSYSFRVNNSWWPRVAWSIDAAV